MHFVATQYEKKSYKKPSVPKSHNTGAQTSDW